MKAEKWKTLRAFYAILLIPINIKIEINYLINYPIGTKSEPRLARFKSIPSQDPAQSWLDPGAWIVLEP